MPLIDMPIEQLREYKGINPRPIDFDGYWERGLKEVNAIDPQIRLERADVILKGFEAYHLYYKSTKNSVIHAQYVRPITKEKLPVILLFHGYGGNVGSFIDKVCWAGQGYAVLAMDCRGQRGLSEDYNRVKGTTQHNQIMRGFDDPDPDNMYFRNVFLDTVQLVNVVKKLPDVDIDRIFAHGGSQGGALTIVCAALNGKDIKKAAPVFPFLSDYKRVWEMDLAVAAYDDITDYIKFYAPYLGKQERIWEKLGYIDIQHLSSRIKADILWFTGLMDTICPPSTQFAAYNKITSKKDMVIYTNHGHEGLPDSGDLISTFFNK